MDIPPRQRDVVLDRFAGVIRLDEEDFGAPANDTTAAPTHREQMDWAAAEISRALLGDVSLMVTPPGYTCILHGPR